MNAGGRLSVPLPAAALLTACLIAGCGSSTLSTAQLRARAGRICTLAAARTNRIATPTMPTQEAAFVRRGIAALSAELTALQRLHAPGDRADYYRDAVEGTGAELAALRSTLKGLRDGNDPVVAIKTLQQQLAPAEARADRAWAALALPACRSD